MGLGLGMKKHGSFTIANIESSFHEQSRWVLGTTEGGKEVL